MTSRMPEPSELHDASDADLVTRVLARDRDAFAVIYERYSNRLFDFAVSLLRQREDAADAVADSFVSMAENLTQLRDPSRLRPWLYAIVRRECLRRLNARTKVAFGDDELLDGVADEALSAEERVETNELSALVWAAADGLGERDRAVLELHLRHGLDGAELAEAMGITAGNAYTSLNRLKSQLERSLGALLIARRGSADCAELSTVLSGWDGKFSVLVRKRVARHVDDCLTCTNVQVGLNPLAAFAALPLLVAPTALRDQVLSDARMVAYFGDTPAHAAAASASAGGNSPRGLEESGRRQWLKVLALVLLLLAVITGAAQVLAPRSGEPTTSPASAGTSVPTLATPSTSPSDSQSPSRKPSATSSTPPTTDPSTAPPTVAPDARLIVTPRLLDLGATARAGTVTLTNPGSSPVKYSWADGAAWILSPDPGTVAPGETVSVLVYVDRTDLSPGDHEAVVRVRWSGGSAAVTVRVLGPDDDGGFPITS